MPKNWTILPFFRWFWLLLKGFLVGSCFISFLIFKRLLQSNMRRLLLPSWVGSSSTVDEHCSFIQSAFIQLLVIILCSGLLWSSALHQFNGKWNILSECHAFLPNKTHVMASSFFPKIIRKHWEKKDKKSPILKIIFRHFGVIFGSFKALLTSKMAFLIA